MCHCEYFYYHKGIHSAQAMLFAHKKCYSRASNVIRTVDITSTGNITRTSDAIRTLANLNSAPYKLPDS